MGSIEEPKNQVVRLPIIDVSEPNLNTGKQLLQAAVEYGFLYIDTNGSGFTEDLVDAEFERSRQFFDLALTEKAKCKIDHTDRGWGGMHSENLDPGAKSRGDFKEAFNIGEFKDGKPQQNMPAFLDGHLDEHSQFEQTCKRLCDRVMDSLGEALEVEEPGFFSSRHGTPSGCTVRWLHYPSIPADMEYEPDVDVRAGAHADYGSMTLLFQRLSQPGLEVRTPDNRWAPVPVIPEGYHSSSFPPVLVNIGDLLSYWTNGILKSTVHRVIFPKDARRGGEDRYSIAYFSHPSSDVELSAVPSKIVAARQLKSGEPVGYGGGATSERAMTAKEYLMSRLNATYKFRSDGGAVSAS